MLKQITALCALGLITASVCGCTDTIPETSVIETAEKKDEYIFQSNPVTVNAFKLDTYISISVYQNISEDLLSETLELCDYYENLFSMHKKDAALYRLNSNETDRVPAELGKVISETLSFSLASEGAFQISVGSLSSLWDFTSGKDEIPSDADIQNALKSIDDSKIKVYPENEEDENSEYIVEKPAETKIDLGAVAKGYIADRLKEDLISKGIRSAVINLGGNVLCVGNKNSMPFNIGIRKPFAGESDMLMVLELKDCSLVTSGISERYFEKDGHIYHHILNPKTGYPYENDIYQCSVITNDSFSGDILSTLFFTLGEDTALKLCEGMEYTHLILVRNDLSIAESPGAKDFIK